MPGYPNGYNGNGKAKIYNLDYVTKWGVHHVYNDLTLQNSGGAPEFAQTTCLYAEFNRCTISGAIWPSIAGTVRYNSCTQGAVELDINVENVHFSGGTVAQIANGSNIRNLTIDGLTQTSAGLTSQISPRNSVVRNSTFTGLVDVIASSGITMRSLLLSSCNFNNGLLVNYASNGAPRVTLGRNASYSAGILSIPLAYNLDSIVSAFVAKMKVGDRLHVGANDPGSSRWRQTGNYGTITSVYSSNDNICHVAVTFNTTPGATDSLMMGDEPLASTLMRNTINGIADNDRAWVGECSNVLHLGPVALTSSGINGLPLPIPNSSGTLQVRGVVRRFWCNVSRAYTGGTAGNFTLEFDSIYPGNYGVVFSRHIDLKRAGIRESTYTTNTGWSGANGESAGANLGSAYNTYFLSDVQTWVGSGFAGSGTQMPLVEIIMEFDNP
jgi:hypothetical protein